jgi:hypothetical protein
MIGEQLVDFSDFTSVVAGQDDALAAVVRTHVSPSAAWLLCGAAIKPYPHCAEKRRRNAVVTAAI